MAADLQTRQPQREQVLPSTVRGLLSPTGRWHTGDRSEELRTTEHRSGLSFEGQWQSGALGRLSKPCHTWTLECDRQACQVR